MSPCPYSNPEALKHEKERWCSLDRSVRTSWYFTSCRGGKGKIKYELKRGYRIVVDWLTDVSENLALSIFKSKGLNSNPT
jgi:hypothetical protein